MNYHRRWKVELHGHPYDFEDVGDALGSTGTITKEGASWYLRSPTFDQLPTARDVSQAATQLLISPMAVVAAASDSFAPIQVGGVVDESDPNRLHRHLITEVGAYQILPQVRQRGRIATGRVQPNQPPDEAILAKRARLHASDPEVQRAMRFLSASDSTFSSIFKAYEIVMNDIGEEQAAQLARVKQSALRDFRANANNPKLSGEQARHAILHGKDPKNPTMNVDEARNNLIRPVVFAWVDHKANRAGNPACFADRT